MQIHTSAVVREDGRGLAITLRYDVLKSVYLNR